MTTTPSPSLLIHTDEKKYLQHVLENESFNLVSLKQMVKDEDKKNFLDLLILTFNSKSPKIRKTLSHLITNLYMLQSKNDPEITYFLGILSSNFRSYENALNFYKKAANSGHIEALLRIGELYYHFPELYNVYECSEKCHLSEAYKYFLSAFRAGKFKATMFLYIISKRLGKNKLAEKYFYRFCSECKKVSNAKYYEKIMNNNEFHGYIENNFPNTISRYYQPSPYLFEYLSFDVKYMETKNVQKFSSTRNIYSNLEEINQDKNKNLLGLIEPINYGEKVHNFLSCYKNTLTDKIKINSDSEDGCYNFRFPFVPTNNPLKLFQILKHVTGSSYENRNLSIASYILKEIPNLDSLAPWRDFVKHPKLTDYCSVAFIYLLLEEFNKAFDIFTKGASQGCKTCRLMCAIFYNHGFVDRCHNEDLALQLFASLPENLIAMGYLYAATRDDTISEFLMNHYFELNAQYDENKTLLKRGKIERSEIIANALITIGNLFYVNGKYPRLPAVAISFYSTAISISNGKTFDAKLIMKRIVELDKYFR